MTEQQVAKPNIEKQNRLSAIWIVPVIAAVLAVFLIYKGVNEAGIMIRVHFPDGNGIIEGKTPIKYKGIDVGVVKSIEVDEKLSGVYVHIEIVKEAESSLNTGTRFWLVKPQASLTEISGLETIISGNYIAVAVGQGYHATDFEALRSPPLDVPDDALLVTLKAKDLGSFNIGSPVYYKRIPVGEVVRTALTSDATNITIEAVIEPEYKHLVKKQSRFWNISGIRVQADMGGIDVQTESLAAMIAGGIAFDSPERALPATDEDSFELFENYEAAGRGTRITLTLPEGKGISLHGTDIRYLGIKVGSLYSVNLSKDKQEVILEAVIDPQISDLIGDDTKFWLLKPNVSFQGVNNLETLVSGYRIQLQPAEVPSSRRHFTVATEPPLPVGTGLVKLQADGLDSIQKGDPILYRGFRIGEVNKIAVADNARLELTLQIKAEHTSLVGAASRFFVTPIMHIDASLESGFSVSAAPMETLIRGGISMINLDTSTSGTFDGSYTLFANERSARSGTQTKPLQLQLISSELRGIQRSAPVYFREYRVGKIANISLNEEQQFVVTLNIDDGHRELLNSSSRFWIVSGIDIEAGLNGIRVESGSLLALAMGGIAFDTPDMQAAPAPLPHTIYANQQQALQQTKQVELTLPLTAKISEGTDVRYAGFSIGKISSVSLQADLKRAVAVAEIEHKYADRFSREGSKFWIEKADVTLKGIKNPEAFITGAFISARPGTGKPQEQFVLAQHPPLDDGLIIFLQSNQLHSHTPGTPILHRQVQVGEVKSIELEETGHSVLLQIQVQARYAHLIRTNTRFWNASGIEIKGGLFKGLSVNTESMSAMISGGIAFSTPDDEAIQPRVRAGSRIRLYDQAEEHWRGWRAAIPRD